MKYLVLLVVLALGYAWWRSQRNGTQQRPPPAVHPGPATPQDMVACSRCGVHLPRSEALTHGPGQSYCPEHLPEDDH